MRKSLTSLSYQAAKGITRCTKSTPKCIAIKCANVNPLTATVKKAATNSLFRTNLATSGLPTKGKKTRHTETRDKDHALYEQGIADRTDEQK